MKGLRKRKVDDSSVVVPASKKLKVKRSNLDLDSTKHTNSARINGSFNKLKVVLDRSIVHNYLGSTDFSRSKLELNSDETNSILRHDRHIQKNGNCENNLEQSALADCVGSQESCGRLPDNSSLVKTEPFDYIDDDQCSNDSFFEDSILVKREYSDEEIDVEAEAENDSETYSTDVDQTTYTKQQMTKEQLVSTTELTKIESTNAAVISNGCSYSDNGDTNVNTEDELLSTVELDKIVATDKTFISNGCNNTHNSDISVNEDLKSQNFILADSNERESETQFENQSNSVPINEFIFKKPITNGTNYYFCNNCKYKTTSKLCLYRHVRDNHTSKDGYIPCNMCNKKFMTEKILECHQKRCGTRLYFTCKFCPKITPLRPFLRRHIISQHPEDFKMDDLDDIMKEITKGRERRFVNEMTEVLKDLPIKNRKIKTNLDRNKVIKMFCSTCNVISDRGRATVATGCSTCDTTLMFQCQMCGKNYDKISAMRAHIKWSCKNAETKLNGDTTAVSQFEREKNVIVYTKPNNLTTDEKNLIENENRTSNNCKQCKKTKGKKKTKVCKHIEYKITGCRYENKNAVCLKCNEKFSTLRRFAEHKIFCGVKIHYPCPFCPYTSLITTDVKRHITTVHERMFDIEKLQDIINGIIGERNKVKEKYIAEHESDLKLLTTKLRISEGLDPAYKRICTTCNVYCDRKKNNKLLNFCPDCSKVIKYECQRCNEIVDDAVAAYAHSNSLSLICKSIKNSLS